MAFDKTDLTHPFPYRQVGGGSLWAYSTTDSAPANDGAVSTYFTDRIITSLMLVGDIIRVVWEAGTTDATYVDFRCTAVSAAANTVTLVTSSMSAGSVGTAVTCAGLEFFNTTPTTITISTQSDGSTNMVLIEPATTLVTGGDSNVSESANGELQYDGFANDVDILATGSISIAAGELTNEKAVVGLFRATSVVGKQLISLPATNDIYSVQVQYLFTGVTFLESISMYIGNTTSAGNFDIYSYNLQLLLKAV